MAKLVLSLNGAVLGNYFLQKERFTIGRRPTCDIQINDQGVSKEHVAILNVGNDQIVEDLGSTNGTVINGQRVQRHILQNGDVIEVGRYCLKFVNAKALPDMDFDKTLMIPAFDRTKLKEEGILKEDAAESIETAGANARNIKAFFPLGAVRGIAGEVAGKEFELDRPISRFAASGQSAIITRRPMGYFITHVAGKRRPVVNGKHVGEEPHPLENLDQIELGNQKLQFYLK